MTVEISDEELIAAGLKSPCGGLSSACHAVKGAASPDANVAVATDANQPSSVRPIIGIVPTYKVDDESLELPDRYVKAVAAAGGVPVVLPFNRDVAIYETLLPTMDGFVLSGGQDIDPVRYGEDITFGKAEEISPGREEVEYLIISFARQYDVPLLGICRGMQIINVAFGGKLYQDLDAQASRAGHWQEAEYDKPTHHVSFEPESKLKEILNRESAFVNSMHHQGIRELGEGLRAAAFGEDGLIEAVEAQDLAFMIGVQWHPEFFAGQKSPEEIGSATSMAKLFDRLIDEARICHCQDRKCNACLRIFREECGGCFPRIMFDD